MEPFCVMQVHQCMHSTHEVNRRTLDIIKHISENEQFTVYKIYLVSGIGI